MKKRMTLLARKDGMSVTDFRNYWAGPHARLALRMDGIERYVQNRVEKLLWAKYGTPTFNIDGIVELRFSVTTPCEVLRHQTWDAATSRRTSLTVCEGGQFVSSTLRLKSVFASFDQPAHRSSSQSATASAGTKIGRKTRNGMPIRSLSMIPPRLPQV